MAFDWNTFNSNRSGQGGWSDWGLDTSTSYGGSDVFGGLDDWFDPYTSFDVADDPFVMEIVGAGGLPAAWDPGLLRLEGFDYDPYELWGGSPLIIPNITFPESPSIDFNQLLDVIDFGELEEDSGPLVIPNITTPIRDSQLGSSANIFIPTPGAAGTQSGPSTREPSDTEVLGPSGREQINTTPGQGSTANIFTATPGAPGTQSGSSTRTPGTTSGGGSSSTEEAGGGGGGIELPSIGGLVSSALGLALLREFLGLFDRDETTYQGVPLPKLSDIPVPVTPRIAPARVISYEEYAPQSRPSTSVDIRPIEGLGRAEGGLASAVKPYMLAQGGRLDFRQGAPVVGKGTGQSDDIPALLSDGEYVIDADTVAALGDGSNKAGAKVLDEFRKHIREHKRSATADKIPPKAKSPMVYLKEAKRNG